MEIVNKAAQDAELKEVEENVPPSVTDVAPPGFVDPDEKRRITHFEGNKMEKRMGRCTGEDG